MKIKTSFSATLLASVLMALTALLAPQAGATGVGILAGNAAYLLLDSNTVKVSVQGQISSTVTTQYFTNTRATGAVKYAFPLGEQASATRLRWRVGGGAWQTAVVSASAQDSSLPGGGSAPTALKSYLGATPLYFPLPGSLAKDSALAVELTYVEFLPYSFGSVTYSFPSNYRLIDSSVVPVQRFAFDLASPRTIDSLQLTGGLAADTLVNRGSSGSIRLVRYEARPNANFGVRYVLNANQLGLFAYSSRLPDSTVPDSLGGFMTFIAEPDPGAGNAAIAKVFTLIVDCSGSMSGSKMTQAKDAASYIVRNLNEGDKFNVIRFETAISGFRPNHVLYTPARRDSALAYIATFEATNSTNISGAFDFAVPQFQAAGSSTANILIFLTDGQPTVGITSTLPLAGHIDSLIARAETNINLFSFGIGTDVNQQLLSLIASHNKGIATFLGNDELYSHLTGFYNAIRNPVLLNSRIAFDPPRVTDVFPDSLPNLYKGTQMIVAGRYKTAGPVKITLSGNAFGQPVSYNYTVNLADTAVADNAFLPKTWAKRKIETLLIRYYGLSSSSSAAAVLKEQIIALSQAYGIISPFTSFQVNTTPILEEDAARAGSRRISGTAQLVRIEQSPAMTTLHFRVSGGATGAVLELRIYDLQGRQIRLLKTLAQGGEYAFAWDGRAADGRLMPAGTYLYALATEGAVLAGRLPWRGN